MRKILAALMASFMVIAGLTWATTTASATGGSDAKVWVCKYVGTPGVDESLKQGNDGLVHVSINSISDYSGVGSWFSDRHGRSYVVSDAEARPDVSACPAPDRPVTVTEWHTWQTSLASGVTNPQNADDVTWPQTYVGAGQIQPPCEVWYQQDLYKGTRAAIDAVIGSPLEYRGDSHLGGPVDWEFVYGGECPPPPPTEVEASLTFSPGTCYAKGSVVAEDTDSYSWTVTGPQSARKYTAVAEDGYVLTGQTEWVFDLRQTSHMDEACLPTFEVVKECGAITITYNNNSKWDRWPDYRIGDEAPSNDYGSGPVYNVVKVPSGESKVIYQGTYDEDAFGGSITIGYQDILGAERDIDTAMQYVDVTTDCAANEVLPVLPTTAPQTCEPDLSVPFGQDFTGGSVTFAETAGVIYSIEGDETEDLAPGSYQVTATLDPEVEWIVLGEAEGWTLGEDGLSATAEVTVGEAEDCWVDYKVLPVLPEASPQVCVPGERMDPYWIPFDQSFVDGSVSQPVTDGVAYSIEGGEWADLAPGDYTVTASPDEGYVLGESVGWTLQQDGTATTVVTIDAADDCIEPWLESETTTTSDYTVTCDEYTTYTHAWYRERVWTLVNNELVPGDWSEWTHVETTDEIREPTDAEIANEGLVCDVPEDPEDPEESDDSEPRLATTGVEVPFLLVGVLAFLVIGTTLVVGAIRARRANS